jgi:hypothetical protein
MPNELKNYIIERCFDACIGDFNDKNLLPNEVSCMQNCANHLKTIPHAYQQSHSFQGFIKKGFPQIVPQQPQWMGMKKDTKVGGGLL